MLWAIGSKETNLNRAYAEGQVHRDGHGWGLFGADDRWNTLDLPYFARDPEEQARLAARTLRANFRRLGNWLDAVNAYGPAAGRPAYGADVLDRAAFLSADAGGTAPMKFVPRSEWGAKNPTGRTSAPGMTRGVGVHWLGPGSSRSDHSQCAGQVREIQAFHMGPQRGWAAEAYNAFACRHGYVFEGRGPKVRNAANGGGTRAGVDANAGWASVCYLEGTDGPGLTPEGQDAINDAAEWLGVATGEWLGHRDFLSTECPGDRIYRWVHAGHPRGSGSTPAPTLEEEVTMFIFDAPPERGGGVWQSDGVFRKPVRTGDTWPNVEGNPRTGRPAVAKHLGVASIGLFDDLVDIEAQLASLRPAPVKGSDVEGLDPQAVADLVVSKLGSGLASEVADLLARRLAS